MTATGASATDLRRVSVVGAGAAGAFFTLELSRLRPEIEVDLYDRPDRGPGAGIVMSRDFVDQVSATTPAAFDLPASATAGWDRTSSVVGEEQIWSGAYGTLGLRRRSFHQHIRETAAALDNVRLIRQTVTAPPAGADLVVIADGAGSAVRTLNADRFGTRIDRGRNRYLWASVPLVLDPSFVLKVVDPGLLIVHAYPHAADESTFIVEAAPETLAAHDLLDRPVADIEKLLAELFERQLRGSTPQAQADGWQTFRTVTNERWHDGRSVLLGDAAHTTHFSTGSGTTLAIQDAWSLARRLAEAGPLASALDRYQQERQAVLREAGAEAAESRQWFERLSRRDRLHGHQTVFALRSRRTMNTYDRLRARDPQFVAKTVETISGRPGTGEPVEPIDLPLLIGGLPLTGRLASVGPGATPGGSLRLPVVGGDRDCPVVLHPESDGDPVLAVPPPSCVLVPEAEPATVNRTVGALRARGVPVVGVLLDDAHRGGAPTGYAGVDFLAVGSNPGTSPGTRSTRADQVRYDSELPVLLISSEALSRDEINTLIAAGRTDLVAVIPSERQLT